MNKIWNFLLILKYFHFNILFIFLKKNKKILKKIKRYHYIWKFKIICLYLIIYKFINILNLKNNKFIIKKKMQKGHKIPKIGIYLRSFLKNNELTQKISKSCYLLIRFKRKNLFLTLLSNEGNVLCKSNIGASGFKKKVKYTGYAIKRTSKRFSKKILGSFVRTINYVASISEKKKEKIKHLIFFSKKKKLKITMKKKKRKKIKKKLKIKKNEFIKINKIQKRKKLINKKIIRKKINKVNLFNKFIEYRKYIYLKEAIRKSFNVIIRIKSNLKFWGFRFVMYGLAKRFRWFRGLEIRLPLPHSKGLRLKKKRRV